MTIHASVTPVLVPRVADSVAALRARTALEPRFALLLGSRPVPRDLIDVEATIPFADLPGVRDGATGRLVFGTIERTAVVAVEGALHPYDGPSLQEATLPVRLAHGLGAETLIVSDSAAAVSPLLRAGEIVLVDDHVNLLGDNPLVGPNDDELGPRFPDMSRAYDPDLRRLAVDAAGDLGLRLGRGVYAAMPGPARPTPAETRMLRAMGVDVVGASVVPEVIVARHMGMRVLGLVVVDGGGEGGAGLSALVARVVGAP